jgi:hypothetical protein
VRSFSRSIPRSKERGVSKVSNKSKMYLSLRKQIKDLEFDKMLLKEELEQQKKFTVQIET